MLTFAIQAVLVIGAVLLLTRPVGTYLAHVYARERTFLDPVARPVERLVYRVCGVSEDREMRWTAYAAAVFAFNLVGIAVLMLVLRLQGVLPLNPGDAVSQSPTLAFNTAVSFVTNTNWQAYSGEAAATYLTQMLGLTWQNFVSAATGMAVAAALVRGLTRSSAREIGNFWVDMTRSVLWVLLPGALVFSLVLAGQGVVQNLNPPTKATTLEGAEQTIAQGPVASQEAIKELGTNGGGFFGANSAHPYENPTPLTNYVEIVLLLAIPAGLTYMFGRFAGDQRQGWAIFTAMLVLFVVSLTGMFFAERAGNPIQAALGVERAETAGSPGGNMEGKEVRFGQAASVLFATSTTSVSCGAVNTMHDSLTPLGGGLAMLNIALGELIFGGVGVGLSAMLLYALLAVFIAGLMVGRTPEYLGKKIEAKEVQMAILAILAIAIATLIGPAIAVVTRVGLEARNNVGPHGLTEILYAFTSAAGNNGSAFAGLAVDSPFYNIALGLGILIGRYFFIVPVLAIAGAMTRKRTAEPSAGTFPTNGGVFVGLLVATVLIVGALTYFPVYALGPIVEQMLMNAGRTF